MKKIPKLLDVAELFEAKKKYISESMEYKKIRL